MSGRIAAASDTSTAITHPVSHQPYVVQFGEGAVSHLNLVSLSSVSVGGDNRLQFEMYGQIDQAVPASIILAGDEKTITVTVAPLTGETSISNIN